MQVSVPNIPISIAALAILLTKSSKNSFTFVKHYFLQHFMYIHRERENEACVESLYKLKSPERNLKFSLQPTHGTHTEKNAHREN